MKRTVSLAVLALVIAVVATLPVMGMSPAADSATQGDNGTAPGEQLSGVVGVQGAELDGALDQRAFTIQFTQAADNDSKAAVLADRLQAVDERLSELRERKSTIEARHDAGEITDGKFRAEMAKIATQVRLLSRAATQTERAAGGVSNAALEERGVNATAIQTLKNRANELSGPEVAEIARSIAGPDAGNSAGPGNGMPPGNETGPPGADDSGTDRGGPESSPNNGQAGGPDEASPADGEERQSDDQADNASRGNETNAAVADGEAGGDDETTSQERGDEQPPTEEPGESDTEDEDDE